MSDASRSVLFTLVDGSTALRTRAGDQVADGALAAYEDIVREAIERHGGRDVASMGEGFVATFVTARSAVDAAVAIQRAMDAYADEGLRVRAGVHLGECTPGPSGPGVDGATAIGAAAKGRQVLISDAVKAQAGTMPGIQFVDRGSFHLGDDDAPTGLSEVVWSIRRARSASPIKRDGASTFTGNEAEREVLRARLDAALGGEGSLVLISGGSGVGKTALAEDVAEEASRRGFLALIGRCEDLPEPPPFMPLLEILRTAMSVVPVEVFKESLGEAAALIGRLLPEMGGEAGGAAEPMDESALAKVAGAARDFLERTSRRRPTLLLLDNLQWADRSSMDLIGLATERLGGLPAVLVGIYREDGFAGRPLGEALDGLLALPVVHHIVLSPGAE